MRVTRSGISRTVSAVGILVVLVLAGIAAYYYTSSPSPGTTTSSTPHTTSTTSTTSTTTSATSVAGHTLAEDNIFGEPNSVDVDSLNSWTGQSMSQQLYQTLIWYKGNTTIPEGVLATSWSQTSDGKTYTFNLKHGIVFSDGKPVSAYSVWFNMYRYVVDQGPFSYILGPVLTNFPGGINATMSDLNSFNFTSPTSAQLSVMQGADQSVQVVDQYTVAFHLSAPLGSFVARIGSAAAAIEEPDFIQTHGGILGPGQTNTVVAKTPSPGTGPYVLKQWVTGCCITLTANPHYNGPAPYFTTVVVNYKGNFLDAVNDLKTGAVQALFAAPFKLAGDVIGVPGISVQTGGTSWFTLGMGLNTQAYPLNITDVRLAINYGTNRTALREAGIGSYGTIFQGPVPLGMLGSNSSIQPYPYNVTKAKELLAAAGFPNGAGLRPLTLMYGSDQSDYAAEAQVFQSEMAQIGITINLQAVADSVVGACITTLPRCPNYPDIHFHAWSPDYAFPDDYAYTFENVNSTNNGPNYNDPMLNQLSNQLLATSDNTQVAQICTQITLRDQALGGWVWLWVTAAPGPGIIAWNSNLQGVTTHMNALSVDFNYSSIYVP